MAVVALIVSYLVVGIGVGAVAYKMDAVETEEGIGGVALTWPIWVGGVLLWALIVGPGWIVKKVLD